MSSLSIPGGGFPPQNELGQRICRQCGVPGREKDGKCVEKWGPGPEGPGTVCDRCVPFLVGHRRSLAQSDSFPCLCTPSSSSLLTCEIF